MTIPPVKALPQKGFPFKDFWLLCGITGLNISYSCSLPKTKRTHLIYKHCHRILLLGYKQSVDNYLWTFVFLDHVMYGNKQSLSLQNIYITAKDVCCNFWLLLVKFLVMFRFLKNMIRILTLIPEAKLHVRRQL